MQDPPRTNGREPTPGRRRSGDCTPWAVLERALLEHGARSVVVSERDRSVSDRFALADDIFGGNGTSDG